MTPAETAAFQRLHEVEQRLGEGARQLLDGQITPKALNAISRAAGKEMAAIKRELAELASKRQPGLV